jgi:PAS domain S-box-containing protein
MAPEDRRLAGESPADALLRAIVEGTAGETGEAFFAALVRNLCEALGTSGAWVTEYLPESRRLRALAFWLDGQPVLHYEYALAGTPCEPVMDGRRLVHIPDRVVELYPSDPDLKSAGAVSYMGVPLEDLDGTLLGHLAVLDRHPLPANPRTEAVFRIFAGRAAAELRRLRADAKIRAREQKLRRLVEGAMDAIVELDRELRVALANPAAATLFGSSVEEMIGTDFTRFLAGDSAETLRARARKLRDRRSAWMGGLRARTASGAIVPAEATLSQADASLILILRNLNERVEAEYLRQEVRELRGPGEILGESPAIRRVLRDVTEVAETDATVLILGETGTGKELVARAIHGASPRRDRPFVAVNCGAIPVHLVESEFFGHVKGAFTGATTSRRGRFALADGGTIFLDEVGELPMEVQVKLLRVLQDGQFEPVGSSETRTVNVRVIAATNRDLVQDVRDGRFRADLYYRLSVFPIAVPPLRERGDDIVLLAAEFARRFAARLHRTVEPLSEDAARRLRAYAWPGNVRELQNVIERAVITTREGRLNLDRALPEAAVDSTSGEDGDDIRTETEMRALERRNIARALEAAGWKIAGPDGAARRLGMNPSTLASRMKALDIRRPEK